MFSAKSKDVYYQLVITILVIVSCFAFSQLVSLFISETFSPGLFKRIGELNNENKFEINLIKILQLLSSSFTFILPSIILAYLFGNKISSYLKINRTPGILYYIIIPVFMFAIMPALNLIIIWNESIVLPSALKSLEQSLKAMEESSRNMTMLVISCKSTGDFIFSLIVVAIIPAFGEELLFRGIIQQKLNHLFNNIHLAVFLSSFIFSAIHFQFYGFIPRMLLGMIFGYMFYYSKSIWPAIFAHFMNNAAALIAYIVSGSQNPEINNFGTNRGDFIYLVLGLVVAYFCSKILFRKDLSFN